MASSNNNRTKKYQKSKIQENILKIMNQALSSKELELISNFEKPEHPVIFIVGAQRSGTTLLMQLVTQLFDVSYPNNFIARYWDAPYIGAMLFKNLSTNLNENNLDLNSDLGYTKGLKGPHEFGYFWKKWFPWKSWERHKYKNIDYNLLQKELAAWQSVNDNALVFKNIIDVSFNIEKLSQLFQNSFFIHIKRKPEFVVQSTYLSRIKLLNNKTQWMGLEPPEFNKLIKIKDIFEQITAQVYYSRKYIDKSLQKIKNHITINYEELVNNTDKILNDIENKTHVNRKNNFVPVLDNTNKIKLSKTDFEKIKFNCKKYFK